MGPEQIFADAGIMAIEHADFDGIERLAAVTGGEITSTFDAPDQVKLGEVDLIEEIVVGEQKLLRFSGCKGGAACTIVLRGRARTFWMRPSARCMTRCACLSRRSRSRASSWAA